jgi:CubicO group peptidase (beta-lactamase class C family)
LVFLFALCFSALAQEKLTSPENAPEATTSQGLRWDWSSESLKTDKAVFEDVEDFAFSPQKKWQTNAVLIIKDDQVLYEKYSHGFEAQKPHRVWSISKSFTSALLGIRWHQLNWSLDKSAHDLMEDLNRPLKKLITIRHLLQMSSGLAWNEFYETNPFQSHVVDMLYINNYKDMGAFTANRPMKAHPGRFFNYSSGETNLIMRLLKASFPNEEDYLNFPWTNLFDPLQMSSATWEQDLSKVFVGSSYLYLTARDLARFGRLYLNDGKWIEGSNESQIVPKAFVKESLRLAPAVCHTLSRGRKDKFTYGMQWWLNKECPQKKERTLKDLPQDVFMALGHHGQMLVVIPSEKAIVVRFGADKEKRFPRGKWMSLVYQAIKAVHVSKEGAL